MKGFANFIFTNVTLKVFITIIVFNMFTVLLNDVIVPTMYYFIDPDKKIDSMKITHGKCTISYGKSLGDLIVGFTLLFVIYFFLI